MSTKFLFGGSIAVILLLLYGYAVLFSVSTVNCITNTDCTYPKMENFTSGMTLTLTTIGGLVSALVIAELAITKPGEIPLARNVDAAADSNTAKILKAVTLIYLAVWMLAGLVAFVVGVLNHPDVLQPLTDLGQSWLGLSVAAGYAYFGINQ